MVQDPFLKGLTWVFQIAAASAFSFIVFADFHFGGYTDRTALIVNMLLFLGAGFASFFPNLILNAIMVLIAIPVINFEISTWDVSVAAMDAMDKKNGWFLVTAYCIVGMLSSVAYFGYRIIRLVLRGVKESKSA